MASCVRSVSELGLGQGYGRFRLKRQTEEKIKINYDIKSSVISYNTRYLIPPKKSQAINFASPWKPYAGTWLAGWTVYTRSINFFFVFRDPR